MTFDIIVARKMERGRNSCSLLLVLVAVVDNYLEGLVKLHTFNKRCCYYVATVACFN